MFYIEQKIGTDANGSPVEYYVYSSKKVQREFSSKEDLLAYLKFALNGDWVECEKLGRLTSVLSETYVPSLANEIKSLKPIILDESSYSPGAEVTFGDNRVERYDFVELQKRDPELLERFMDFNRKHNSPFKRK